MPTTSRAARRPIFHWLQSTLIKPEPEQKEERISGDPIIASRIRHYPNVFPCFLLFVASLLFVFLYLREQMGMMFLFACFLSCGYYGGKTKYKCSQCHGEIPGKANRCQHCTSIIR